MLATDGLSDPYDLDTHPGVGNPGLGCACELIAETTEAIATSDGAGKVAMHWLEWVVWKAADIEAEQRVLYDLTGKFSAVTLQVAACPGLEEFTLPTGFVPLLVGVPAPGIPETFPAPAIDPALLAIKVLRPDEYEHAVALGDRGGVELCQRFVARGDYHLNTSDRPSVLSNPEWKPPVAFPRSAAALEVPFPHELPVVDRTHKRINVGIAVVGDAARDFMRFVHQQTSKNGGDASDDAPNSEVPGVGYFTLQLGAIRGYTTVFHMYGLVDHPGLADITARMLPHVRGLIIAHRGEGLPSGLRSRQPDIPTAVLGSASAREAATRGTDPVLAEALQPEVFFAALKAVARGVLVALRDLDLS